MPAEHIKIPLGAVSLVGVTDLLHSGVGSRKFDVIAVDFEVIGAAEVILGSGSADGGELGVVVDIEFNLAFAPPTVALDTPVHVGSHIMAVTLDVIQDGVGLQIGQRIDAAELGVEIQGLRSKNLFLTVDLVVNLTGRCAGVLNFYPEGLEIGHFEIAVHAPVRIEADCKTGELPVLGVVGVTKEIGQRRFHSRILMAVKVDAQDQESAGLCAVRDPEMLDGSLALYVGEDFRFTRLGYQIGVDLPALAQLSGGMGSTPDDRHSSLSLLTGQVLGRY